MKKIIFGRRQRHESRQASVECDWCDGKGKVLRIMRQQVKELGMHLTPEFEVCAKCDGSGRIEMVG